MSVRQTEKKAKERGSVMVETAFVVSALALLIIGVVDLSRMFFVAWSINDVANYGYQRAMTKNLNSTTAITELENELLTDLKEKGIEVASTKSSNGVEVKLEQPSTTREKLKSTLSKTKDQESNVVITIRCKSKCLGMFANSLVVANFRGRVA